MISAGFLNVVTPLFQKVFFNTFFEEYSRTINNQFPVLTLKLSIGNVLRTWNPYTECIPIQKKIMSERFSGNNSCHLLKIRFLKLSSL